MALAEEVRERADIAAVGEMGIGNTTSASALLCAYTGMLPEDAVGPGTGVDAVGVSLKAAVIQRALTFHKGVVEEADPTKILATFGGFEIATMTGFLLGAAAKRLPVVVDGFISSSAALAARAMSSNVMDYLFFSHVSAETAHKRMLGALNAHAILDLEMRLGEGSGAAMVMPVFDAAVTLYSQMATFPEASVRES